MRKVILSGAIWAACLAPVATAWATETENLNMRILPAPGQGRRRRQVRRLGPHAAASSPAATWRTPATSTASGSTPCTTATTSICLARWLDPTPMNHPGTVKGDYGFNGDCLQVRVVTAPDIAAPEVSHHRSEGRRRAEGPHLAPDLLARPRQGSTSSTSPTAAASTKAASRTPRPKAPPRRSSSIPTTRATSRRSPSPGNCWPSRASR